MTKLAEYSSRRRNTSLLWKNNRRIERESIRVGIK